MFNCEVWILDTSTSDGEGVPSQEGIQAGLVCTELIAWAGERFPLLVSGTPPPEGP